MPLRTLDKIFPDTHRSTRYRWKRQGLLGGPDFVANGREFYDEDRFKKKRPGDDDADEREQAEAQ